MHSHDLLLHCVSKNDPTFERYSSKITMIDFDDIWQKYSKDSRIEFACFSFHVGLLLYINFCLSIFSNRTPKITRILTQYQANAPTLTPFSKKKLIKNLYKCKSYNTRQFITKFLNKGWTKNSINRLLGVWWSSEQSTGVRAAADGVHVLMKTSTQLSRCCWVRKTNLRATEQSEKFHVRRGVHRSSVSRIIHKDLRLNSQVLREKARFNSCTEAYTRYFRYAVWETITW